MQTSEHEKQERESVETAIQFRRFSRIMDLPPYQRAAELKKLRPLHGRPTEGGER